ncbi:MAG TPA: AmmeMemoRadiSam system protein A [Methylophilaceae bacterium]|nr:AmmeMemoRadiSam system protein A [Methylophilaceae bacterium]
MPETKEVSLMPINQGEVLLTIARSAISEPLGKPVPNSIEILPWLREKGATFVTLTKNQELRGCIGTLEAHQPLIADVKANAFAAAFRDPRFFPLTENELDLIKVEVSLLSPMKPLQFSGEQDALSQLQSGIDGLVLEFGKYRSTFLPQVWEQLPEPSSFMAHLKHKAGLQIDFWSNEIKLYRYTVSKWKEKDITNEAQVIASGKEQQK